LQAASAHAPGATGRGPAVRLMLAEHESPPEHARIGNRTDGGALIHAPNAAK